MKIFGIFPPCSVSTSLTVSKNNGWHISLKCFLELVIKALQINNNNAQNSIRLWLRHKLRVKIKKVKGRIVTEGHKYPTMEGYKFPNLKKL